MIRPYSPPRSRKCEPYSEKFLKGFRQMEKRLLATLAMAQGLTGNDFRVLAVAQLEERNPGDVFPLSISIIGMRTGLARRTVQRSLRRLRKNGILQLIDRGRANRYVIVHQSTSFSNDRSSQVTSATNDGTAFIADDIAGGVSDDALVRNNDTSTGVSDDTSIVRRDDALGDVRDDTLLNTQRNTLNTQQVEGGNREGTAVRKQAIRRLIAAYTSVKPAFMDATIPRATAIISRRLDEWDEATLTGAIESYKEACQNENKEDRYRLGVANFFEKIDGCIVAREASMMDDSDPLTPEQMAILDKAQAEADPGWLDRLAARGVTQ